MLASVCWERLIHLTWTDLYLMLLPRKNFVASDSVLTLFNGVPTRDWPTMWHENKHVWSKHINESSWAVRDSATILEILAGMQTIVANNSEAGGDPSAFADHITFMSMMNEKRGDLQEKIVRRTKHLSCIQLVP